MSVNQLDILNADEAVGAMIALAAEGADEPGEAVPTVLRALDVDLGVDPQLKRLTTRVINRARSSSAPQVSVSPMGYWAGYLEGLLVGLVLLHRDDDEEE